MKIKVDTQGEPDTYSVELECRNCGYRWAARYPKGTPVPRLLIWGGIGGVNAECPHCGINNCERAGEGRY